MTFVKINDFTHKILYHEEEMMLLGWNVMNMLVTMVRYAEVVCDNVASVKLQCNTLHRFIIVISDIECEVLH